VRVQVNPTRDWSMQVSYGHINSPEQLAPEIDQDRVTASATYNYRFGQNNWQTTAAWGRNYNDPGETLDAFLVETAVNFDHTHTIFSRFERVAKDELFDEDSPLARFDVHKMPMPQKIVRDGQRLPASYANFYVGNKVVLLPAFADTNDRWATAILEKAFPGRKVVPIDCRELIWGLGAFHCLTQQMPAV